MHISRQHIRFLQRFRRYRDEKLPITTLFVIGVFIGIVFVNIRKNYILNNMELFSAAKLYDLRECNVNREMLFYSCIRQRLGGALFVALMSSTYLGFVFCACAVLGCGLCAGTVLAIAVLRYGLKGVLLIAVGILPQFLIYIPAAFLLIRWGEKLYGWIYVEKKIKTETGERFLLPRKLLQLFGILVLFAFGCAMEAYVNPGILQGLLKIF